MYLRFPVESSEVGNRNTQVCDEATWISVATPFAAR